MANVVVFHEDREPEFLESVNTPDYLTQPVADKNEASKFSKKNVVINPDLSSLSSVPKKYWKKVGNGVIEMTDIEKKSVDDLKVTKEQEKINNLDFDGSEAIKVLIEVGLVTKKQVTDALKTKV